MFVAAVFPAGGRAGGGHHSEAGGHHSEALDLRIGRVRICGGWQADCGEVAAGFVEAGGLRRGRDRVSGGRAGGGGDSLQ